MEKELKLQPRLACLASCVPEGARLADVGTDHGYVPVRLLQEKKIAYAIASDIGREPLEHARRTAAEYEISEGLDFRLCPGLEAIGPAEVDTVLIAGMGGETIMEILAAAPWTKNGEHLLLLQPQTKIEELRIWLVEQGYCCVEEKLVLDKEKLYVVLLVRGGKSGKCGVLESYAGFCLSQDSLYGTYLDRQIKRLQLRAAGLERGGREDETLAALIDALKKKREEWTNANS
ncbi:MAG: SAM-dependent methyltransferase [Oscillospiraceae bacterium]|nr:SAM-dependent methyltransferase [Oscillospiraceae bacterium]